MYEKWVNLAKSSLIVFQINKQTMRLIFILTFGFFTLLPIAKSQDGGCGLKVTEADMAQFDKEAFKTYRQEKANRRSNENISLGITIHIVETVPGFANISIEKLYEELDAVNRFFAPSGISFFYCGSPRFIQGRDIYTYDQAARELNSRNNEEGSINIYYMDEIGDNQLSSFACGISQFPWRGPLKDRFIIMQKSCSTNGAILAHELGHFFGLFHTHETFRGRELVNGSNCETAGDLLCDTRADPNLGATGLNGCTYQANFVDANGDRYNPDPTNIMSYSPSACQRRFSPNQNDLMNFYLETTDLNEIVTDCNYFPDYAITSNERSRTITSGQSMPLNYTFNNEGITEDQEVEIFWKLAQEGEIELTIQKDVLQLEAGSGSITRTFNVEFPISKGTGEYTLTAVLDPDSKILERDKRNNFHATALSVDNAQFSDVLLFPNPVRNNLRVFIRDRFRSGEIRLLISDYLGRTYTNEKKFKNGDEFFAEMDVNFLPQGLYVLNVFYERDDESTSFVFLKE